MFLSWEPETASWRILATTQPPPFHWYPQAKTKATYFSINKHKIEGRHFFIPEKHSKALNLPQTSPTGAGCSVPQLVPSPLLHVLSTYGFHISRSLVFPPPHFSGFCEVFSSSYLRLLGSVLCLLFPNYTHSLSDLIQSHAFKYHLYANTPHIYFSTPNPGWGSQHCHFDV